ncbi:hypothetical protein H0H87_007813, partial [Tephrocybe sp. NHM501043]
MDKKREHEDDRKQSNKIIPPKCICITQDQQIAEQELMIKELKKTIESQSFEIAEQNLTQRYKVELKEDKCMFKLELSCYKESIKYIAKKFKWEQMCQDSFAIVVQVSDLELDCLKAEHQAAQATWMKENKDFKKQLTAADNKVNNLNEVILSLTTKLTTQLDSFKKERDSSVHYTEKEHTTCSEELQKKIAVLEEDMWDRHKRLDLELHEKSKTAVQTSISLFNNRLSEEQMKKVEYKMSSETVMAQLEAYKKKQEDLVHHTQDKHALQKKIVVLEEDVQDRHKRLEIELNEKSKTAVQ